MVNIAEYLLEEERMGWQVSSISQSGPKYRPEDGSIYTTTTYWFYPGTAYRDGIPVERVECDEFFDSDLPFAERIVDIRVILADEDDVLPLSVELLDNILRA